jgi:hypothetical protein
MRLAVQTSDVNDDGERTARTVGERRTPGPAAASEADATPLDTDADASAAADVEAAARLRRVRELSHLLDSAVAVPGTRFRVGLDPLLGLLPVVGDAPTTLLSAYVVAEAAALGAPRATVARMVGNLVVDAVVGSVPVVGDLFDAAWRANERNVRLLEARVDDPGGAGARADRRLALLVGAGVALLLVALGAAATVAAWWLLGVAGVV